MKTIIKEEMVVMPTSEPEKMYLEFESSPRKENNIQSMNSHVEGYYSTQNVLFEPISEDRHETKRYVINGKDHVTSTNCKKRIGKVVCMCPECGKISPIEIDYMSNITRHKQYNIIKIGENGIKDNDGAIFASNPSYQVFNCDGRKPTDNSKTVQCKYSGDLTVLDPLLADIIVILNDKNFFTYKCSQGSNASHAIEEKIYRCINFDNKEREMVNDFVFMTDPFIEFLHNDILDYMDFLPLSWYVDYDSLRNNRYIIKSDVDCYERFRELYLFVKALPVNKYASKL